MSNQTPDRSHASGKFVPVVALPFTGPVVNSDGVDSFVRNSVGNYTIALTSPLAFAEGIADAKLPANFLGIAGAQIAPDGASVLVTVFDLAGAPADPPIVSLKVTSVEEGEGEGPSPALPAAPVAPLVAGQLFGWCRVNAAGAIQAQSPAGLVTGVVLAASVFTYTLVAGSLLAAMAAELDTVAGEHATTVLTDVTGDVLTFDSAGAVADIAHTAFFYRL